MAYWTSNYQYKINETKLGRMFPLCTQLRHTHAYTHIYIMRLPTHTHLHTVSHTSVTILRGFTFTFSSLHFLYTCVSVCNIPHSPTRLRTCTCCYVANILLPYVVKVSSRNTYTYIQWPGTKCMCAAVRVCVCMA